MATPSPIEDRTRSVLADYDKSIHPSEFTDELAALLREWLVNHARYQRLLRDSGAEHRGDYEGKHERMSAGAGGGGGGGSSSSTSFGSSGSGSNYTDRIERTEGGPDPLVGEPNA